MSWTNPRQEKLTAEDSATLRAVCEKWDRIGRSTASADRREAEQGVIDLYQAAGIKAPRKFIWYESFPGWSQGKGGYTVARAGTHGPLWGIRNVSVRGIRGNIARYFTAPAIHSVEDIINASVFAQWSLAEIHVYRGLEDLSNFSQAISYGQDDTGSMAFADFFAKVCGVSLDERLTSVMRIISSCGYFVPGEDPDLVLLHERPGVLRLDDRKRPHCLDGPAIEYRGKLKVYAIHGVPVPQKYIETPAEQMDLMEVLQEQNAEVRMAVISKVGFSRLLKSMRLKEEGKDFEQTCPRCGEHFSVEMPKRVTTKKDDSVDEAVVVSKANGNSLIELRIRKHHPTRNGGSWLRVLHLTWQDKTGPKETIIPVPRTMRQFGRDCPDNINDCEQVRRWTLGWPKDVEILTET